MIFTSLPSISLVLLTTLPINTTGVASFLLFSGVFVVIFVIMILPIPNPPMVVAAPFSVTSFATGS